jgi:hypothetical protein
MPIIIHIPDRSYEIPMDLGPGQHYSITMNNPREKGEALQVHFLPIRVAYNHVAGPYRPFVTYGPNGEILDPITEIWTEYFREDMVERDWETGGWKLLDVFQPIIKGCIPPSKRWPEKKPRPTLDIRPPRYLS